MGHDVLKDRDGFARVEVAAVWPASAQIVPLPIPEIPQGVEREPVYGAPAAPDVRPVSAA